MSMRSEFKSGFGRASGYWIGKAVSIGGTMLVLNDIASGKAALRIESAKRGLVRAKDRYLDWINR